MQPVVPIMPGTVVKEAGRGGSQRFTEYSFTMMIEDKTDVRPRSEHHDLADKERCVIKCCVSGLPPANPPSDGGQPFRTFFCCQRTLHNFLIQKKYNKLGVNVELGSVQQMWRDEWVASGIRDKKASAITLPALDTR
jgi:hypothetical protein